MNRYLQWLLGLAALIVVAIGLIILSFLGESLWRKVAGPRHVQDVINVDADDPSLSETLRLSDGTLVGDGPAIRVMLYRDQDYAQASGLGSYDKSSSSNLVNIGFLEPGQPARWMFPNEGVLIYDSTPLFLRGDLIGARHSGDNLFDDEASLVTVDPTRGRDGLQEVALMLTLIESDSNGDSRLSRDDHMVLALTRPDGSGRTDLATDLTAPARHLPSLSDLAFLIETAEGNEVLRVSPGDFSVTDRQHVVFP